MPTVIVGALPAARITDKCVCIGPIDMIVKGSATVLIGGLNAARIGDMTTHGGVIVTGMPTVLIGDLSGGAGAGVAAVGAAPAVAKPCLATAARTGAPFVKA